MRVIRCKCRRCAREYDFEDGGEAGYSQEFCGPFCHGFVSGRAEANSDLLTACKGLAQAVYEDMTHSQQEFRRDEIDFAKSAIIRGDAMATLAGIARAEGGAE